MNFFFKTILFVISFIIITSFNVKDIYINPTGIYKLGRIVKNEKRQEYYGEINVLSIDSTKIVVYLFVCRGYPSFNLGTFVDTLAYKNNKAIHLTPKDNPTCDVQFYFSKQGVTIVQSIAKDFCEDFGMGVYADGYFRKTSSEKPIIKED